MTVDDGPRGTATATHVGAVGLSTDEIERTCSTILGECLADEWGQLTPSYYDTAQVARLTGGSSTPSLPSPTSPSPISPPPISPPSVSTPPMATPSAGTPARLALAEDARAFLLATQLPDGGWPPSDAAPRYRLVSTLAAATALLSIFANHIGPSAAPGLAAADRALRFVLDSGLLRRPEELPDTVAIEMIVPAHLRAILDLINQPGLAEFQRFRPAMLAARHATRKWADGLTALRQAARSGSRLPVHATHTIEVLGDDLAAQVVGPMSGPVGCSPAATAAVLAGRGTDNSGEDIASLDYLRQLADAYDGAVPNLAPITTFERVWITLFLVRAGVPLSASVRATVRRLFRAQLAADGAAGMAAGFPYDCDDTSSMLAILGALGEFADLTCLRRFEIEDGFCTYYPGERTRSATANAHALYAMGRNHRARIDFDAPTAAKRATGFLINTQLADGSWTDKWHSSPYYATMCCVTGLTIGLSTGLSVGQSTDLSTGAAAISAGRGWVLETQYSDGSWGLWGGTAEETAYAVLTLLLTPPPANQPDSSRPVIRRGVEFLREVAADPGFGAYFPARWHGKELFTPYRIVTCAILSALHLATRAGVLT